MKIKSILKRLSLKKIIIKISPDIWYLVRYYLAGKKLGNASSERDALFQNFIKKSHKKKCLQIGVRREKYGTHWVSVDLYDQSELIDYRYDIHDLKFEDNTFDTIVCRAILEHVENPQLAISELHRVLKKGGKIWIEVPFNQPYHPSPNDYWRVTPEGLILWMKDFKKISCKTFQIDSSAIYNGVFFCGEKK